MAAPIRARAPARLIPLAARRSGGVEAGGGTGGGTGTTDPTGGTGTGTGTGGGGTNPGTGTGTTDPTGGTGSGGVEAGGGTGGGTGTTDPTGGTGTGTETGGGTNPGTGTGTTDPTGGTGSGGVEAGGGTGGGTGTTDPTGGTGTGTETGGGTTNPGTGTGTTDPTGGTGSGGVEAGGGTGGGTGTTDPTGGTGTGTETGGGGTNPGTGTGTTDPTGGTGSGGVEAGGGTGGGTGTTDPTGGTGTGTGTGGGGTNPGTGTGTTDPTGGTGSGGVEAGGGTGGGTGTTDPTGGTGTGTGTGGGGTNPGTGTGTTDPTGGTGSGGVEAGGGTGGGTGTTDPTGGTGTGTGTGGGTNPGSGGGTGTDPITGTGSGGTGTGGDSSTGTGSGGAETGGGGGTGTTDPTGGTGSGGVEAGGGTGGGTGTTDPTGGTGTGGTGSGGTGTGGGTTNPGTGTGTTDPTGGTGSGDGNHISVNLSVAPAAGLEDQPIALTIGAGVGSPGAGETVSVTIAGVPVGATLSAGTDNHDGTWTLTAGQLTGLTITPPTDYSGTLTLSVTAHAELNGATSDTSSTLAVTVAPVADAPTLAVAPAVGLEDQPIALTIAAGLHAPADGETLSVTIAGVPAGATLSAGTDNGDGTWTLTSAQLTGLTLTPPADYSGTLNLSVTAHAEVGGTSADTSSSLAVTVAPVADAPTLAIGPATGLEDQPIALTIAAGLHSPADGETLSVTIAGVPAGATLSAGTDNGDGTWTLTGAQLTGLTLTPPTDYSGTLNLSVTAHAEVGGTSADTTSTLAITVAPVADAPTLTVLPATGQEDQPIALTIAASLHAPADGETLSVTIAGVPAGATLSAGTNNGDGTWTLTGAQLTGLTITPPADYNGTLNLSVTAHAEVGGTGADTISTLSVTVTPTGDTSPVTGIEAPTLSVQAAAGLEDQPIALTIAAGLHAPVAGETLSVTIAGVPSGATLSAGTDNHDGTWTLTGAQLTGLTITPPTDYSGTLNLSVTAHADVNGTTADTTGSLAVTVAPVADAPSLTVAPAVGLEDQPIALTIAAGLHAPAAGETLSVTIAGVPAGATLSAGTDNHDGTWTLTGAQLTGLTITPPADYSGTLNLSVTAHAEVGGTSADTSSTLAVTVAPVADVPTLAVLPAVGLEDQPIALTIAAGLHAPADGETLSVTIAGVPAGATLNHGHRQRRWLLDPDRRPADRPHHHATG
ncbi:MAG: Ig-like domain-containing protein [Azospirillaceae bacterium]|nr:Ig-like domain-containing protein [Azospirillaceae bacterium]